MKDKICFLKKKHLLLHKKRMDYKFRVDFLEEVKEFLDNLDDKTRQKIIYNIWKSHSTNDQRTL